MKKIKLVFILFLFLQYFQTQAQEEKEKLKPILSFQEFIGFVKKHHPLAKQAELQLKSGEANLLKSRGGFDPKIEVDYARKDFKETTYYNQLNAMFKIPTWYGVEFKATFEDNEGTYLNPSLTTPDDGLYSAGVSVALGQGLLINKRMASLKKARFYKEQTKAKRDLMINELLYEASVAYFSWLEATIQENIYTSFVQNSEQRLKAVERSVETGDKARIAISEGRINMQNRQLGLEEAIQKRKIAALKLSNYLWVNRVPLELEINVRPVTPKHIEVENSLLLISASNIEELSKEHPKLKSIEAKIEGLKVDFALKKNKLLPKINLNYNFLTEQATELNSFKTSNYKAFVDFSMPLFLRKERGAVRLSKIKLQDANFKKMSEQLIIKNKIKEAEINIISIAKQSTLVENMIKDYDVLVKAEERKFFLGESSLFLINYREEKLIQAKLKGNSLNIKGLKSKAKLYNTLGLTI